MASSGISQFASPQELEQAVALNHWDLFQKEALTLGGTIHSLGGLKWTSGGPASPSMVAFPALAEEETDTALDSLMNFYRRHKPAGAGCWSLDPPTPSDLGLRLLARGFQTGWRPRWMALDLNEMRMDHAVPKGLVIKSDNISDLSGVRNLPYSVVIIPSAQLMEEGQWIRFVAYLNGKVAGQSVVYLLPGQQGAAGIYHVGVCPQFQKKGIGKAVTRAACLYARERGYRYAVLNSTRPGQRTYEQLGFSVLGDGWTWWLKMEKLLAEPPSPQQIQLAEAIGRGDQPALERWHALFSEQTLNRSMTNGMTLMELAVLYQQTSSAEWLVKEGAYCSVLDAWDLGWKEKAEELLARDPERVNQLMGEWNKTILHIAAERNDIELARLALAANPDLRLKDGAYRSTALEWARHFGHEDITGLIQSAGH